jgi:phosphatidyl-myo-inositol alpha-mannosyltransferase
VKIGLVSPYDYSFPSGVVNHISHLADYFNRWGNEVRIIAPCLKEGEGYDDEHLQRIGRPLPVPFGGSIARIPLSPWLPVQIRYVLRKEKFDILHLHEPFAPMLCVSMLAQSKCINVGTFHASHARSLTYYLSKSVLKRWMNKLHGKIAVSEAALNYVNKYFPNENYQIIPNGIDIERFSTDGPCRKEFADGKLNILFVGRLEKRKGLDHLINACAILKKQYTNFRLIIVGPGTAFRRYYKKHARSLGIEDVVFTDFVSNAELPEYYRSADIFCAPATGGESFGIVLLEAMACGKPAIASDIEGYAAVLGNNAEGLLVPVGDDQALAQAIFSLAQNPLLRKQMGARGLVKARKYSWESIAKRVSAYYEELIYNAGKES